jgi:hypothetical protein
MPAPAIGTNLQGSALVDALINALATIMEEAVGTSVGDRAAVIGTALVIAETAPIYRAEVRQSGSDTITLHLEAL